MECLAKYNIFKLPATMQAEPAITKAVEALARMSGDRALRVAYEALVEEFRGGQHIEGWHMPAARCGRLIEPLGD